MFEQNIPYQAFFAIYLIIACNFIGELFGCKLRQLLSENMLAKHFIGYLTLLFFAVLTNTDDNTTTQDVIIASIISFILYVWFVLTTKTHLYVMLTIIALFFIMYVVSIAKKNELNNETLDKYDLLNYIILFITIIITILGVYNYMKLKIKERGKLFNYYTFFIGKPNCRNDKIDRIF